MSFESEPIQVYIDGEPYLLASWVDMPDLRRGGRAAELTRLALTGPDAAVAAAFVRGHIGQSASDEEVFNALESGFASGELQVVRTKRAPRTLDALPATPLRDLMGPEVTRQIDAQIDSWIGFRIVDQRGRPLPFFCATTRDPTGQSHAGELDDAGSLRLSGLRDDGACSLTLEVDPGKLP